uniref:Serine/arginine repetitive matrix protein 2 n=1 Tax=Noccaea caerulescens TaxID=107243 RepID=A0A1J3JP02_NOCCA
MGCCLSKKTSPSSSSPPSGGSFSVKSTDPNKSAIDKSLKPEAVSHEEKLELEDSKPRNEVKQDSELQENIKPRKEVFVIKHRRSHDERSKTTDPEDSSVSEEKSNCSNQNPVDVDAILIQCGRLSRSNSAAAKTRRYSGSKRSFDFDQSERSRDGDPEEADAEDGGEEEAERRIHRQRHRGGDSPRERRRRTPSREREDSKSHRSGSRERGSGGSRRVSRSPGRRSEINPNPKIGDSSGSSVNSSNNRPAKFVSVPALDKSTNGDSSIKRIAVKRNVEKTASPRSQSPARAASPRSKSPARAATNTSIYTQPSPSKLRRKTDHSPYRRNPLSEIDPNSLAYPQPQGDKLGSSNNTICIKKMMNRENESQGLIKECANLVAQKSNAKTATQAPIRRTASPSRVTKEQPEAVEEIKIVLPSSGTEIPTKPPTVSRSRSLRKSRDFDFSPEALLSNSIDNNNNAVTAAALPSYTALLLEDIQNFHQKSVNVNVNALSSSMSKACSIVEAVADLNSTTKKQNQRTEFNSFKPAAVKKADLMEPSFEKYVNVTVKRGGSSLEDMEQQESSGSNSITGSSCVVQRQGYNSTSSSSWEPNSAESTDRMSVVKSNKQERDRSPFGVQEFDPLKKNGAGVGVGRNRVALVDSS